MSQIGDTIAFHRRRRGLSQAELARLLDRSESWVSQVERGVRAIDRLTVLEHVADVLNIPASELLGDVPFLVDEEQPSAADGLRLVLSAHSGLIALLQHEYGTPAEMPELEEFAARVTKAWALVHGSDYGDAGSHLADLIPALEVAARQVDDDRRPTAFRLLATAYQATAALLAKLREVDGAWVAADRAVFAAEQAGDTLLVAAGDYRLAGTFFSAGRLDQAQHAAATAAAALEPHLEDGPPELVSLWGAFNLVLALVSARKNDPDAAHDHLQKARVAADRLGKDRNDFDTEFGPTNVRLHEVHVEVELGNAGQALRLAATVGELHLSPERRARFLIDVARAYAQRRRPSEALHTLQEAEGLAPQQVRDHRLVRELVRDLLQGSSDPELLAFAKRVKVTS